MTRYLLWPIVALTIGSAILASAASLDVNGGTLQVFQYSLNQPLGASVDIKPETLQLTSKGEPVLAFIELPAGYRVADIEPSSVRLCLGTEPCPHQGLPITGAAKVGDHDGDGAPELKVTFDRAKVIELVRSLVAPTTATLTVSGTARDLSFRFWGTDTIRLTPPASGFMTAPAQRSTSGLPTRSDTAPGSQSTDSPSR